MMTIFFFIQPLTSIIFFSYCLFEFFVLLCFICRIIHYMQTLMRREKERAWKMKVFVTTGVLSVAAQCPFWFSLVC